MTTLRLHEWWEGQILEKTTTYYVISGRPLDRKTLLFSIFHYRINLGTQMEEEGQHQIIQHSRRPNLNITFAI